MDSSFTGKIFNGAVMSLGVLFRLVEDVIGGLVGVM